VKDLLQHHNRLKNKEEMIQTIELSIKSSKESIKTVSLLKTRNKVVEVG
jgi:hypothetical protein